MNKLYWGAARLYRGPTAVIMTTDDGEREEVFPTRFQAELFLAYIPMMAAISDEFAEVRAAILSPLAPDIYEGNGGYSG